MKKNIQNYSRAVRLSVLGVVILLIVTIALLLTVTAQKHSSRAEQYKSITGAAGLAATISYDCQDSCDQKYDFNVYIFNSSGQQVSVIHPDKDGKVNAALPEGEYSMLIGKRFGKDKLFPQEPLMLKNGQELELKLHYK